MDKGEKINTGNGGRNWSDFPEFNPDAAEALCEETEKPVEERFCVPAKEYPIFARQGGVRLNPNTGKLEKKTLSINETLGLMVGRTAELIADITGESGNGPAMDHVIYLDKSARPVSWMVEDFWDDFADKKQPEQTFLAIDRRVWFEWAGVKLVSGTDEYVRDNNGTTMHVACAEDFDRVFEAMDKDEDGRQRKHEALARIRALYIEGGIMNEDIEEIMRTPTILDGQNLLIVDEVSRSGSTLHIAKKLLKAAIPELKSVEGHVFWFDNTIKVGDDSQMGFAPVWYPEDKMDWRGRGVKDINPIYYKTKYLNDPTPLNRAKNFGSFVLGEPLENPDDEPGQPSLHLREEMYRMHEEYKKGHILPTVPFYPPEKMIEQLCDFGVEFVPVEQVGKNPRAYPNLIKKRDATY